MIRREAVPVAVPIPKGYVPTLAVCLLNSTAFDPKQTPLVPSIVTSCASATLLVAMFT